MLIRCAPDSHRHGFRIVTTQRPRNHEPQPKNTGCPLSGPGGVAVVYFPHTERVSSTALQDGCATASPADLTFRGLFTTPGPAGAVGSRLVRRAVRQGVSAIRSGERHRLALVFRDAA